MLRKMFAVMAVTSIMVAGCGEAAKPKAETKPGDSKMAPAAKPADAKPVEKK
jgi:hypothetical protein